MEVLKNMWIEEILDKYPRAQEFLSRKGIVCVMCGEPVWGSLEEQMEDKDFSTEKMDTIVQELNEFLKDTSTKKNLINKIKYSTITKK
ncbi:MAG: DUF1858 domain-containing protein [Candidatus Cloacimonadota bacterium]|nr:DUF1858 domain-containing protein [Candidatus Cloacimonadota bacterium]